MSSNKDSKPGNKLELIYSTLKVGESIDDVVLKDVASEIIKEYKSNLDELNFEIDLEKLFFSALYQSISDYDDKPLESVFYLSNMLKEFNSSKVFKGTGADYVFHISDIADKERTEETFKHTGDVALFMAGYNSDFERNQGSFYRNIGGWGYVGASNMSSSSQRSDVYQDLANNFKDYVIHLKNVRDIIKFN